MESPIGFTKLFLGPTPLLCPPETEKKSEETHFFSFFLYKIIILKFPNYASMYMNAGSCRSQREATDPQELEFPDCDRESPHREHSVLSPHGICDCATDNASGVSKGPHTAPSEKDTGNMARITQRERTGSQPASSLASISK